jgi:cytochrome d ubiquinol oxidase subunit I
MVFGIPDDRTETSRYAIHVPWALGLMATRSFDTPVLGIRELRRQAEQHIRNGIKVYSALQQVKAGSKDPDVLRTFEKGKGDLGYALLLTQFTKNVAEATPDEIAAAAAAVIPRVAPLFWSFRLMVGLGLWFLFLFACAVYFLARRKLAPQRWLQRCALYSIPLPWIAAELGWFVAEYGRQPWIISEILPTSLGVSTLSTRDLWLSLAGFIGFYTLLLVIELYLMFKYARLGPSSLGSGTYHHETAR